MRKPVALCCSDIHLTDRSPVMWDKTAWWSAQEYMLEQINGLSCKYNVPILAAGDCFDRPKMSPKVELLALRHMRSWTIIPGQHDLPQHNLKLIPESSYGVLQESLYITPLDGLDVFFFPWGKELIPHNEAVEESKHPRKKDSISIALVHAMVWENEPPYPGAPSTGNVKSIASVMAGYDFIVCGDNHHGFVTKIGDTTIINCGSTMRRTVAQIDYKPKVHLIYSDKTVESIELDTSKDVVSTKHKEKKAEREDRINAFVETLGDVEISLSYQANMHRAIEENKVEDAVKEVILEAMV